VGVGVGVGVVEAVVVAAAVDSFAAEVPDGAALPDVHACISASPTFELY
jgi:hypothetical protein